MSWWGKLVGGAFGFMLGGPLGAALGVALGHNFDKGIAGIPDEGVGQEGRERIQMAFFTATFAVMGRVAKADGRVSPEEINMAQQVMAQMDLSPEMRQTAMRLFNEGKSSSFPLDDAVEQLRRECRGRTNLIRMFIEIQLQAAYADGELDSAEDALLLHICQILRISEFEYRRIQKMLGGERAYGGASGGGQQQGPTIDDAYDILGVDASTPDKELKKAYRRLISQHHPDKLASKGLPEEMMKVASQKTHQIKQAYDMIKEARKL